MQGQVPRFRGWQGKITKKSRKGHFCIDPAHGSVSAWRSTQAEGGRSAQRNERHFRLDWPPDLRPPPKLDQQRHWGAAGPMSAVLGQARNSRPAECLPLKGVLLVGTRSPRGVRWTTTAMIDPLTFVRKESPRPTAWPSKTSLARRLRDGMRSISHTFALALLVALSGCASLYRQTLHVSPRPTRTGMDSRRASRHWRGSTPWPDACTTSPSPSTTS